MLYPVSSRYGQRFCERKFFWEWTKFVLNNGVFLKIKRTMDERFVSFREMKSQSCFFKRMNKKWTIRWMSKSDMGSFFHINIINEIFWSLLISSDTKRTLRPERTGFNMYSEYTQLQLTFLALHSLVMRNFQGRVAFF